MGQEHKEVKRREPSYNLLKALMMLLVINGYLVAPGVVTAGGGGTLLSNFNIGVAMPSFFFVSGFFAYGLFCKRDLARVSFRLLLLVWPMLMFGLHYCGGLIDLIRGLLFLRVLCIVYALMAVVFCAVKTYPLRVGLAMVVYALLIFAPSHLKVWYTQYVLHMFPYFAAGALVGGREKIFDNWKIGEGCGIVFWAAIILEGDVSTNGMGFYWVSADWHDMLLTMRGLVTFVGRTLVGITGTLFLLWALRRIVNRCPVLGRVSVLGDDDVGRVCHSSALASPPWTFELLPTVSKLALADGGFPFCALSFLCRLRNALFCDAVGVLRRSTDF